MLQVLDTAVETLAMMGREAMLANHQPMVSRVVALVLLPFIHQILLGFDTYPIHKINDLSCERSLILFFS